jgi:hypothetical protein
MGSEEGIKGMMAVFLLLVEILAVDFLGNRQVLLQPLVVRHEKRALVGAILVD